MEENHTLLEQVKQRIEKDLEWGDSARWTNQDFLTLSEKIAAKTNTTLSHVTLKRIWGKVSYNSLPNTHTLNTLAQFAGYESWREFTAKNTVDSSSSPIEGSIAKPTSPRIRRKNSGLIPD